MHLRVGEGGPDGLPGIVEEVAVGVEEAEQAVAAGIDMTDPEKGKVPVAAVILKEGGVGSQALVETLKNFARERLAPYKCPRAVYFMDTFPKTTTGKVLRRVLRQVIRKEGT